MLFLVPANNATLGKTRVVITLVARQDMALYIVIYKTFMTKLSPSRPTAAKQPNSRLKEKHLHPYCHPSFFSQWRVSFPPNARMQPCPIRSRLRHNKSELPLARQPITGLHVTPSWGTSTNSIVHSFARSTFLIDFELRVLLRIGLVHTQTTLNMTHLAWLPYLSGNSSLININWI